MDPVFEIIKELPNKDLQVRRIGGRRTCPCPSCGENVAGCYSVRTSPRKPVEQLGIVIPCPECGTFTIDVSEKNGREVKKVKETGAAYDEFSRVRAAHERLKAAKEAVGDGDKTDLSLLPPLAEAAGGYAKELSTADPLDPSEWMPYRLAVSTYCTLIESGRTEYVEPLARLSLECNSIAKYELMEQMRHAYLLIRNNRDKVPPALYSDLMIEQALLMSVFDSMFLDDPDKFLEDSIRFDIEDFESLCPHDRAEFPYAASNGWYYILKRRRRNGAKNASTAARKVIAAIRDARMNGAPEDREQLLRMAMCYRAIVSDKEKTYRDMIADAKHWSDPLYLAIADFTYAEHVFSLTDEDSGYDLSSIPPEARSKAVKRLDEAIEILETVDDLKGFAFILTKSYLYRGILAERPADKKMACLYAEFFYMTDQSRHEYILETLMAVSATEEPGSPVHKWAMARLGEEF